MSDELNLVIAGLSGQGIVMAGKMLTTALVADGRKVIISDSLALTHRNAPTHTQIRVGEDALSLIIAEGEADLVVAFEAAEGLKTALVYASEDGLVILNDRVVRRPSSAAQPKAGDSDASPMAKVLQGFERAGIGNVRVFPGSDVAQKEVGRLLTLNMVMLGATVATGMIPVRPATVARVIGELSPTDTGEINVAAFQAGAKRFKEQSPTEGEFSTATETPRS